MIKLLLCNSNKQIKIFFYISVCLLLFASASFAEKFLEWSPVNNADGYKVYCMDKAVQTYFTNSLDMSNNTKCSINSLVSEFDLIPGKTYYFAVSAYSNITNILDSLYSDKLSYLYDPSDSEDHTDRNVIETAVIDNLDNQNLIIKGNWRVSGGEGPYAENSFYTTKAADSFTFKSPFAGNIRISLHWTYFYNRCLSVPVKIYDGSTLIDTVFINQRENYGQWYVIGEYTFGNTPHVVISAEDHPEVLEGEYKYISICADAVKLELLY